MSSRLESVTTDTEAGALKLQFQRDGYLVVKQAFSQQKIEELRTRLLDIFEKKRLLKGEDSSSGLAERKKYRAIIPFAYDYYPEILEVLGQEDVLKALKILLGDPFVVVPECTLMRDYFNTLHTDLTRFERKGYTSHLKPDWLKLTMVLYLQDNTPELGGGMYVVPGTHNQPDPQVKLREQLEKYEKSPWRKKLNKLSGNRLFNYQAQLNDHPDGFDVYTKAGDLVIFNSRLLHRSSFPQDRSRIPQGEKLGLFYAAMNNCPHVDEFVDYQLKSEAELAEDKAMRELLLQGGRDMTVQNEIGQRYGFIVR